MVLQLLTRLVQHPACWILTRQALRQLCVLSSYLGLSEDALSLILAPPLLLLSLDISSMKTLPSDILEADA